jgi:glycosyltransferase involved in cell wall biosynthesis
MRMLFIGPLPEPVTGQSLACRVLLDGLPPWYQVDLVDLSKKEFVQGVSSWSRVVEVLRILGAVWRSRSHADAIYFTVSQSLAGNAKDLVIYALCRSRLDRMVIHLHGGAGMRRILQGSGLQRWLNTVFLRQLGAAIVLGESQRAIYRGAVPDEKIHVVPNFAEDAMFTTVDRIEAKYDRVNPFRILFLSNLLPGKGHDELVDAFLGLDADLKATIRLDLAGAFESVRQHEALLARISADDRIQYHGPVAGERKRDLFHNAHLFCLPTYYPYEGQPISLLEAYASGCAVVTTGHSGIPDVFRDRVNGLQVAPRSVPDLRRALEQAVRDCQGLRQIARLNWATASTTYRAAEYQRAVSQIIAAVGERR